MNNSQKALQLRPLLVLAARTKTIHTYGMVAQMTSLANQHPEPLGHIAYYCMQRNLTLLSSLEVDKNGQPAAKFYKYIEVKAEQTRCFTYNWLEHGVPTLEQLEDAYRNGPKLEADFIAAAKKAAGA